MKENYDWLRRSVNGQTPENPKEYVPAPVPVELTNPKTKEFEIVRTSLLPGLLKTAACNKHNSPPIKLFEVSDVVYQAEETETGARNYRRAAALYMGQTASFDIVHGLLDQVMLKLNCIHESKFKEGSKRRAYKLEPSKDPAFFPGFQGSIVVDNIKVGVVGVVHPEVLGPFELHLPCSALELNLEAFLDWL